MKKILISLVFGLLFVTNVSVFASENDGAWVRVGDQEIFVAEGEKVSIPLVKSDPYLPIERLAVRETFWGDGGYLDLYNIGDRLHYEVKVNCPATSFGGFLSVMNHTTGMSSGRTWVTGFSGNIAYGAKNGHRFGANLDGSAYFLGKEVAKTVPNYFTWISR